MRPILILCSFVLLALCFAPACQAGGVFVGRGLLGPRVVVQNRGFHGNNAVVVNRGFFGGNRVFVGNGFHGRNNAAVFANPGFNNFGGYSQFNGFAAQQFSGCFGGVCH